MVLFTIIVNATTDILRNLEQLTDALTIVHLAMTPAMIHQLNVYQLLEKDDILNVLANTVMKDWIVILTVVHPCLDLVTQEKILVTEQHQIVQTLWPVALTMTVNVVMGI